MTSERLPAIIRPGAFATADDTHLVPALIADAGDQAAWRLPRCCELMSTPDSTVVVATGNDPVAVVLDLVQPVLAGGRPIDEEGLTGRMKPAAVRLVLISNVVIRTALKEVRTVRCRQRSVIPIKPLANLCMMAAWRLCASCNSTSFRTVSSV